jgi:glycogen debranching enzyme
MRGSLDDRYVIAFPLWAGLVNATQASAIAATLRSDDMLSEVGLRSTSSSDPRYQNSYALL